MSTSNKTKKRPFARTRLLAAALALIAPHPAPDQPVPSLSFDEALKRGATPAGEEPLP